MKRLKRILLAVLLIILLAPYLIPSEFDGVIPQQPYDNSQFFTTDENVTLHYRLWMPETPIKGQILMIHGLGASTFSFRHQTEALKDAGYVVVAVDLPAFGYSDKRRGIDHSQLARASALWQMLDAISQQHDLDDPWTITGHSMGGSTALAMSNQRPLHVSSLIMIAPAITTDNASFGWLFRSFVGQWMKVYLRYFAISEDNFADILDSASNGPVSDETIKGYLEPLMIRGTNRALIDFVATAKNVTIDQWVANDTPMLVIWGEQDQWVSFDQLSIIRPYVKDLTEFSIKEEGHLPHETSYDIVNQTIMDWLES